MLLEEVRRKGGGREGGRERGRGRGKGEGRVEGGGRRREMGEKGM